METWAYNSNTGSRVVDAAVDFKYDTWMYDN